MPGTIRKTPRRVIKDTPGRGAKAIGTARRLLDATQLRCYLDGLDTGFGLASRLLPFGGGHRIEHETGTGLHAGLMIAQEGGADGDGHVHIAGEVDVTYGTAIYAAWAFFKFV